MFKVQIMTRISIGSRGSGKLALAMATLGLTGLTASIAMSRVRNGVHSLPRITHRNSKGRKRTITTAQQKRNKIKRKNKAGK